MIIGSESVTADLSFEMIRDGESVIVIRVEALGADFDILVEGSRRDKIRFDAT